MSANPTGPLHVGHGRQAALGDAIAALLEWTGWAVSREFYYNDAGVQIQNLAASVMARIAERQAAALADPGGRISRRVHRARSPSDTSRRIRGIPTGAERDRVREFAVAALRREQDRDLQAFGVRFDTYYLESSLYTDGHVDETVAALERTGLRVRAGRRALAPHDRVRRRQGLASCASATARTPISCRTSRIT